MTETVTNFDQDIEDIAKIEAVPVLLNVICQSTGMGFAAIARVTEDKWITCSALDNVAFGLKPGDELPVKSTLCNEVRQLQETIVIDHVAEDPAYCNHHTPATYGLQSYISVPIILQDGSFFGTLCAIDPQPNRLNTPAVTGMFKLFAELISFHLHAIKQVQLSNRSLVSEREEHKQQSDKQKLFSDELERNVQERTRQLYDKNLALEKMNSELESIAFIASHDLQEPLRKILAYSDLIAEKEKDNLSDIAQKNFERIKNAAQRMRSLINDFLSYSQTNSEEKNFEKTDIVTVMNQVKEDLQEEIESKQATIEVTETCVVKIIPFQFRQLLFNIISNSLKFSKPGKPVRIIISARNEPAKNVRNDRLLQEKNYSHINIADNGIGFNEKYSDVIFKLFQQLHNRNEFSGTGVGLAIVNKIVENHRGVITARGKENEGAIFDIYLPAD